MLVGLVRMVDIMAVLYDPSEYNLDYISLQIGCQ